MDSAGSETVVHSVRTDEGELRFAIDIAGLRRDVWLTTSVPVVPGADVALAMSLLPAMTVGGRLVVDAPVDRTLLARVPEIQAVLRSWARAGEWPTAAVFKHEVEVVCEAADPALRRPDRGVGSFFSGGVDSFSTVLGEPAISHLIYVSGLDVALDEVALDSRVRSTLAGVAEGLGRELITARTNVRELGDAFLRWVLYFGSVLGAIARMLAPELRRVHIASSVEHAHLLENGAHPLLDHLWGGDGLEVFHDGAQLTRSQKLARIADDPTVQATLRVCWLNPDGDYNCGRCEKCLRTMATLEALGVRDRFATMPDELDLDAIAAVRPAWRPEILYWLEILRLAAERDADPTLIRAIEACLANVDVPVRAGRTESTYRRLERSALRAQEPTFYWSPETWSELRSKRAVVFLIGSYDGSGNYGDIAQLQAALDLLAPLAGDDVALLPAVDLRYLEGHRGRGFPPSPGFDPGRVLVYAPPWELAIEETGRQGLVPAALPPGIERAGTYLYGGGYLNRRWADRMLKMIEATDELGEIAGVAEHARFATGLQIEPSWAAGLGPRKRAVLARFAHVGGRDELSVGAARSLASDSVGPRVSNTGDDAVGVIGPALDGCRADADGEVRVNLHICPEPWVTDEPERLLRFSSRLVDSYARAAQRRLVLQPVIAYEDGRISERAPVRELVEATRAGGAVEAVEEPLVLRPDGLASALETLSRATLTIGSSYHVALTSLLAGVPAALVRENDYYGQKGLGLRSDFALPSACFPSATTDPGLAAEELYAAVGGPGASGSLRRDLDRARLAVLARRETVEREVLAYFREGLAAPATRAAHDDVVHVREFEGMLAAAAHAQRRAAEAEELAEAREEMLERVARSLSWRITAPLRAGRRRTRRLG